MSLIVVSVAGWAPGFVIVTVYPFWPPAGVDPLSAVFEAVRTVAPCWHVSPAAVPSRSLSRKIAES